MSELYSRMDEELEQRIQEAEIVGVGLSVPVQVALKGSKESVKSVNAVALTRNWRGSDADLYCSKLYCTAIHSRMELRTGLLTSRNCYL